MRKKPPANCVPARAMSIASVKSCPSQFFSGHTPIHAQYKDQRNRFQTHTEVSRKKNVDLSNLKSAQMQKLNDRVLPFPISEHQLYNSADLDQDFPTPVTGTESP